MIEQGWRNGSIAEVVALSRTIPEFNDPYGESEYQQRLSDRRGWLQIAEVQGETAGFAAAYMDGDDCYLWMSGVQPDFRALGLMADALEQLQIWALRQGATALTVKSRNRYPSMLRLLLKHGFLIEKFDTKGDSLLDHRIYFRKPLV
ncbi:GNAT family N-acetyltransferase [Ferrimonas senticii]|uniref:GNAT family N-acetyltransferase n=1 Tax=Ferrimonas senticii TaxID=394566 RepID=UPI000408F685|nr:GNAT family N-acetyltransferase [Ferrimonas senticii]